MMVHNFTNNNKTNNLFSPQIMEHNKTMTFGVGNTRSKVAGAKWLMGSDDWTSKDITDINKQQAKKKPAQIRFHSLYYTL